VHSIQTIKILLKKEKNKNKINMTIHKNMNRTLTGKETELVVIRRVRKNPIIKAQNKMASLVNFTHLAKNDSSSSKASKKGKKKKYSQLFL
jgi:hypothetical protein